jgi:hypothetical protein
MRGIEDPEFDPLGVRKLSIILRIIVKLKMSRGTMITLAAVKNDEERNKLVTMGARYSLDAECRCP